MWKTTDRSKADFYGIMGPIFGSRKIQRLTTDRFYDDEGKTWHYGDGEGDDIGYVFSIKDSILKNAFIQDEQDALNCLMDIIMEISTGKIPVCYRSVFERAGFDIIDAGKNYMTVKGWGTEKPAEKSKKRTKKSDEEAEA